MKIEVALIKAENRPVRSCAEAGSDSKGGRGATSPMDSGVKGGDSSTTLVLAGVEGTFVVEASFRLSKRLRAPLVGVSVGVGGSAFLNRLFCGVASVCSSRRLFTACDLSDDFSLMPFWTGKTAFGDRSLMGSCVAWTRFVLLVAPPSATAMDFCDCVARDLECLRGTVDASAEALRLRAIGMIILMESISE